MILHSRKTLSSEIHAKSTEIFNFTIFTLCQRMEKVGGPMRTTFPRHRKSKTEMPNCCNSAQRVWACKSERGSRISFREIRARGATATRSSFVTRISHNVINVTYGNVGNKLDDSGVFLKVSYGFRIILIISTKILQWQWAYR